MPLASGLYSTHIFKRVVAWYDNGGRLGGRKCEGKSRDRGEGKELSRFFHIWVFGFFLIRRNEGFFIANTC